MVLERRFTFRMSCPSGADLVALFPLFLRTMTFVSIAKESQSAVKYK
jgi:hypothetical protein